MNKFLTDISDLNFKPLGKKEFATDVDQFKSKKHTLEKTK